MVTLPKAHRAEQEHLYGCSVDLAEDETPDGCVLDYGSPGDCIHASKRRTKWTCPYWVLKSEHCTGRAADVEDLVGRLRATGLAQCDDAAAALEAQAEEIARLRDLFQSDGADHSRAIRDLTERHATRITKYADAVAALKSENERLREALEHITELLIDSWAGACDGDPEDEMAVRDAYAALHPTQGGE